MNNLYVDIHVLQDIPPANLNRDDSGSPKSAIYGGVQRLRVSSQAWKRAARLDFRRDMPKEDLGLRTRRLRETFAQEVAAAGVPEEQAGAIVTAILAKLGIKESTRKRKDTEDADGAYLFFFSLPQLGALSEKIKQNVELWGDPKELANTIDVQGTLNDGHALDVALFGRMVADIPNLNVDAAAQVSHALATHASSTEHDYFTAVDDAQQDDEAGAGMIGNIEFNSATLYRYATVSVPALIENMSDRSAAIEGTVQFVRSFIRSLPAGKQNTFAAHTRPGLVLVTVRTDQPVNYMSAFEKPVWDNREGYLAPSIARLAKFVSEEQQRWGDEPDLLLASYASGSDVESALGASVPVQELLETIESRLQELTSDG